MGAGVGAPAFSRRAALAGAGLSRTCLILADSAGNVQPRFEVIVSNVLRFYNNIFLRQRAPNCPARALSLLTRLGTFSLVLKLLSRTCWNFITIYILYVCICVYMYVCICLYVCIYVSIRLEVSIIYIYICMLVYTVSFLKGNCNIYIYA